jgi:hypothetical protein
MLNQVSKALSTLFRPLASSKSDADRDPGGSTFERYSDNSKQDPEQSEKKAEQVKAEETPDLIASDTQATGKVIPFPNPEAAREAQKKAIGISQAWLSLKDLVKRNGAQPSSGYERTSSQSSSTQLSKKGAILDKKAG